ncbi:MAG: hypothetical protein AB7H80_04505 [Candidatus Kapaibacterium sp.]
MHSLRYSTDSEVFRAAAPPGQSEEYTLFVVVLTVKLYLREHRTSTFFTVEANSDRTAPEGSAAMWPWGKPQAAPHGRRLLFASSALKGRLSRKA